MFIEHSFGGSYIGRLEAALVLNTVEHHLDTFKLTGDSLAELAFFLACYRHEVEV